MSKRLIVVLLMVVLCLSACSSYTYTLLTGESVSTDKYTNIPNPHQTDDGKAFKIGYVDDDEYEPASIQLFYIVKALEEYGWIKKDSIPFTLEEIKSEKLTTKDLFDKLSTTDLGEYIEFESDAFWYLSKMDKTVAAEEIRKKANQEKMDLIFTFGTNAGVFVKNLYLSIPMVDYSATDPVASGIIQSATNGTGSPYVWAQVEPSIAGRQVKYYHSIKPFNKLGVIAHADEIMSGIPDIYESAEEVGFEVEYDFIPEQKRETNEDWETYYSLVTEHVQQMAQKDIDAFFLPIDLIWDADRLESILAPLYEKGIPVYIMDGEEFVEKGGLMLISANDMEGIGFFVAEAVIKIFDGTEISKIPCVYKSAPAIYFNYDIACMIDYPMEFGFLTSCDKIYSLESKEQ